MIKEYTPTPQGKKKVQNLKESIADVMRNFAQSMENGTDRAIFLMKLEEAAMYGTKAILQKKEHRTGELEY